jgi:hypothetical protein
MRELVTRHQKTVFTSFLVFMPAGVAAVIWFQLTRASSSAVVAAGEITILVIALAINQAALVVPLAGTLLRQSNGKTPTRSTRYSTKSGHVAAQCEDARLRRRQPRCRAHVP